MSEEFVEPNEEGTVIAPEDFEELLDSDESYTAIAFDPGGRTGWSVFQVLAEAIKDPEYRIIDNISFWSAGEFYGNFNRQLDEMMSLIDAWPEAHLVIEDFKLRKFSSAEELLDPVRVITRLEDRLYVAGDTRPLIKQPASLAMSTVTDERMKKMNLYHPLAGQPHARDSVRHNFTWMRRAKQIYQRNAVASALMNGSGDD